MNQAELICTLAPCPDLEELGVRWREAEAQAEGSFFTSWTWIGAWLGAMPARERPPVLTMRQGGQTVALVVVGRRTQRRRGFVISRRIHLNGDGHELHDDVTIEYNGLLARRGFEAAAQQALARWLTRSASGWDELVLPGFVKGYDLLQAGLGEVRAQVRTRPVFGVDLDAVRANSGGYLPLLKEKPRYQVRKSCKAYAKLGPVTARAADSLEDALAMFDRLQGLHQPYWQARGQPGAFGNDYAQEFHRRLIATAWPRGEVQFIEIKVGERTLGVLYNFVFNGESGNYQSGIDYTLVDGSDSPGLVCHAEAVALCAAAGLRVYDFLAGEHRYKRQLSTLAGEMHWIVLQRPRLRFRLEDLATDWVRRRRARAAATPDAPAEDGLAAAR
jgi:CelD/BcsL family acetyltransferase involved in cellulose biosynthesis